MALTSRDTRTLNSLAELQPAENIDFPLRGRVWKRDEKGANRKSQDLFTIQSMGIFWMFGIFQLKRNADFPYCFMRKGI